MARGVHPRVQDALVERFMGEAEAWARKCVQAGLKESELKDAQRFASESLNTVNIIDWFKRRATRNAQWRKVATPEFISWLMGVREWAKSLDENVQKQAQIVASVVDLVGNAALFFAMEAKVRR